MCNDTTYPTTTTTNETYFLGISHSKTKYPPTELPDGAVSNIYFSRFYAFEQTFPYTVVARSGLFCFGHPSDEEYEGAQHALFNTSKYSLPMELNGMKFNCPKIHFALSILDKVDDVNNTVIVSYGVSDCLSRFVELSKHEIADMLWPS